LIIREFILSSKYFDFRLSTFKIGWCVLKFCIFVPLEEMYKPMKRVTRYFAVIVCLLAIFSCNPFNIANQKIIEKFKATIREDGSTTYDDYFTKLAGLRGEVNYSVLSDDSETNRDIKIIEVSIDKRDESVEFKTAKLQYLFNKKTGFIKLKDLEINGESQNLLAGLVILELMMLESALR